MFLKQSERFARNRNKTTTAAVFSNNSEGFNLTDRNSSAPGSNKKNASNLVRRYIIIGERRLSNYWWTTVVFLGACGFLYTGISAYLGQSLVDYFFGSSGLSAELQKENPLTAETTFPIDFFPQGLLMSFYGSLGLLVCFYWILLMFWNVGGGFNEFNKKDGLIRIFRWGYPGKNRKIDFVYSIKDVEAIRVEIKQGFDPQRTIYLRLKGTSTSTNSTLEKPKVNTSTLKREIPLTGISQPLTLKEIEKQASELANFLQVSLEGL